MQKLASWNYLTMMKPLGNVHGGYPDNAEWEEVYILYTHTRHAALFHFICSCIHTCVACGPQHRSTLYILHACMRVFLEVHL